MSTVGLVPPETRAARLAEMKEISDFAKLLAVSVVGLHLGFRAARYQQDPLYAGVLESDARVVRSLLKQISRVCIWKPGKKRPKALLAFIRRCERDNLFINFDPANMILYGRASRSKRLEKLGSLRAERPLQRRQLGRQPRPGMGPGNAARARASRHGELSRRFKDRLLRPADGRTRNPPGS